MRYFSATACAACLLTAGALSAAGLDRSGQPVGVLFQSGNHAELSFSYVQPEVSGTAFDGALPLDNIAGNFAQLSFSLKVDLNDRLSLAVILDQPYGADISYPASADPYPFAGATATVRSQAITGLLQYRINDRFSVHGGLRGVAVDAEFTQRGYTASLERATAVGHVVGVAYEIPDIALRAALTWSSATDFSSVTTEIRGTTQPFTSTTDFTLPQQITLDFQTGIAADTLLLAQVRWVEWTATDISPARYPASNGPIHYKHDRFSYTLGIDHRFSDSFSGAITLGYEPGTDTPVLVLGGTDGQYSLQAGGTYTIGDVSLTGSVRHVWLGDATTESAFYPADLRNNHAVALDLSVGYRF